MSQNETIPYEQKEPLEFRQGIVRDIKRTISSQIDAQFSELDTDTLNSEISKTERVDSTVGIWEDDYIQLLRIRKNIGEDTFTEFFQVIQLVPAVKGGSHSNIVRYTLDEKNGALIKQQIAERHSDSSGPLAELTHSDEPKEEDNTKTLSEMLAVVEGMHILSSDKAEKVLAIHSSAIPEMYKTDFDKKNKSLRGRGVKHFIRTLLDKNDFSGEKP